MFEDQIKAIERLVKSTSTFKNKNKNKFSLFGTQRTVFQEIH